MKEKSSNAVWFAAWLLLALPVLYALSIGPVLAHYQGRETPELVYAFYSPVTWLVNHSQIANGCLDWYLQFWLESP